MRNNRHPSTTEVRPFTVSSLASLALFLGRRRPARAKALGAGSNGDSFPDLARARSLLDAEITRARRYEHLVSIAILQLDGSSLALQSPVDGLEGAWAETPRSRFALLGPVVRRALRESDIVSHDDGRDRFVLLLPQTNTDGAYTVARRMHRLVHEHAGLGARAGVATFPKHGLILDALLEAAGAQLLPLGESLET